jgi:catechol 2,3-dioxygenase-like lactoylglutathione lyase family enzyme
LNLNQVTLSATDVARSTAFYRLLGFKQIVSNLPHYARFECQDGSTTFSLQEVPAPVAPGTIIYFECADLDAVYEQLRARGVQFDEPPTDQAWLWREAYLRDPDRNVLCLYYAGDNRRFPPWRIPSSDEHP